MRKGLREKYKRKESITTGQTRIWIIKRHSHANSKKKLRDHFLCCTFSFFFFIFFYFKFSFLFDLTWSQLDIPIILLEIFINNLSSAPDRSRNFFNFLLSTGIHYHGLLSGFGPFSLLDSVILIIFLKIKILLSSYFYKHKK